MLSVFSGRLSLIECLTLNSLKFIFLLFYFYFVNNCTVFVFCDVYLNIVCVSLDLNFPCG